MLAPTPSDCAAEAFARKKAARLPPEAHRWYNAARHATPAQCWWLPDPARRQPNDAQGENRPFLVVGSSARLARHDRHTCPTAKCAAWFQEMSAKLLLRKSHDVPACMQERRQLCNRKTEKESLRWREFVLVFLLGVLR